MYSKEFKESLGVYHLPATKSGKSSDLGLINIATLTTLNPITGLLLAGATYFVVPKVTDFAKTILSPFSADKPTKGGGGLIIGALAVGGGILAYNYLGEGFRKFTTPTTVQQAQIDAQKQLQELKAKKDDEIKSLQTQIDDLNKVKKKELQAQVDQLKKEVSETKKFYSAEERLAKKDADRAAKIAKERMRRENQLQDRIDAF
jgi:hypothetical protein